MPMAMLQYIDNVFLKAKDPQKLIDFYAKSFDLSVAYNHGPVQKLRIGGHDGSAMLTVVDETKLATGELSVLSFNVVNAEEAFERVRSLGIHCDTYVKTIGPKNEYKHFEFRDPIGNLITVAESPAFM